jgi:hypothetical protein
MVCPVSINLEVDGQRTSRLLIFRPGLIFGRRGGSNRNLVAMSETIHDPGLFHIIRRHLELHSIANCQANKSLPHFSRNMSEHEALVSQSHSKHCAGQDAHDRALDLDCFFGIHSFSEYTPALVSPRAGGEFQNLLAGRTAEGSVCAIRTRPIFTGPRFVDRQGAPV